MLFLRRHIRAVHSSSPRRFPATSFHISLSTMSIKPCRLHRFPVRCPRPLLVYRCKHSASLRRSTPKMDSKRRSSERNRPSWASSQGRRLSRCQSMPGFAPGYNAPRNAALDRLKSRPPTSRSSSRICSPRSTRPAAPDRLKVRLSGKILDAIKPKRAQCRARQTARHPCTAFLGRHFCQSLIPQKRRTSG